MKPKLVIVIGFLVAVGVILYVAAGRRAGPEPGQAAAGSAAAGPGSAPGAAEPEGPGVEIAFEYSTEKKDWLEAALSVKAA